MNTFKKTGLLLLTGLLFVGLQSCDKDDDDDTSSQPANMAKMSSSYDYEFNNGQVVAAAAYRGQHSDDLMANIRVDENSSTTSTITVTLMNTLDGETYHIHAHDAADPATTPNGTPYNEAPNTSVFTKMTTGNGGTVQVSQSVNMSYNDVISSYDGFLVVHDPLQSVSTTDISTYVVVGSFARMQTATGYSNMTFPYDFNTGQLDPSYAYSGTHAMSIKGNLRLQELADGTTRVTATLENTMNSQNYMVHSHDAADPSTTPNGTPYDETPNSGVCTVMISGNGGTANSSQISSMSYSNLTTMYNGFFVVHDPLQSINTADPSTYLVLGVFARI